MRTLLCGLVRNRTCPSEWLQPGGNLELRKLLYYPCLNIVQPGRPV